MTGAPPGGVTEAPPGGTCTDLAVFRPLRPSRALAASELDMEAPDPLNTAFILEPGKTLGLDDEPPVRRPTAADLDDQLSPS